MVVEQYGGQILGSALTSEYTAAEIGEGVKDAVGCHDKGSQDEMKPLVL